VTEAATRPSGRFERGSGLILHPTSLPGPYGVGDLGPEALQFVDFLVHGAQTLWQMLPLGPTGYGHSPYAARSAFAGNPLLISPERLVEDGLLQRDEVDEASVSSDSLVDFEAATARKQPLLERAVERLYRARRLQGELEQFRAANAHWLDDYALFAALRESHDLAPWHEWDPDLRLRRPTALEQARAQLKKTIDFHLAVQFLFWRQWGQLRQYANERGVRIVGDIPIFVALDSADVWANQGSFQLDEEGLPTVVAGVPPDAFSDTGQRWGNPLYRWDTLQKEGYRWWIERFRAALFTFDVVRIDHFRGFAGYWEIPAEEETAVHGRWVKGPGARLFAAARAALGVLPIVVEDLGEITDDVLELRDQLGYPGMKVFQFAFDSGPTNPYLPHNHVPNAVVYTGTHDNDTTLGWWESAGDDTKHYIRQYLSVDGDDIVWDLIRAAYRSVADLAIVPMQDVLELGSEARMNFPGRSEGNWAWRLVPGQLREDQAIHLRELAHIYGRAPRPQPSGEME
jgi:4-alpha-glucanotransferase